jgi:hypothetical protein
LANLCIETAQFSNIDDKEVVNETEKDSEEVKADENLSPHKGSNSFSKYSKYIVTLLIDCCAN